MRWSPGEAATAAGAEQGSRLAAELGLLPAVGRALWARGVRDAEAAHRFLTPKLEQLPDPFGLKGIETAVARLQRALEARETICVYGDYDVDGVTSTALLVRVLRKLASCAPAGGPSARIEYYVPNRVLEGYGLNLEALRKLAARGTRLLVSADCGVTAVAEIDAAAQLGLDVVVIDHHTSAQTAEALPRAVAILNPHQPGCAFPGRELAAVGVAFHLLLALRRRLREAGWFAGRAEPNLREHLDLVALGTIADVVPLTGANRVLVHYGLRELARAARPGVLALKSVARIAGEVTCGDVGFKLGPRLNAAGRLSDASVGVRLLLSEDPAEARELAEQLDRANAERQDLQARIADEAVRKAQEMGDRRALVVSSPGWHLGVVGIVASRLVDRFHRPALVLCEDEGGTAKGSGRSIEGFHLYDALASCAVHLTRFGGHRHAAGVTLPTSAVHRLAEALETVARERLAPEQLEPRLRIDSTVRLEEIDRALAEQLRRLAPFGAGNPEPVFACDDLEALEVRTLPDRRSGGPGHLKLRLAAPVPGGWSPRVSDAPTGAPIDAIAFGMGGIPIARGARLRAAFQIGVDSYFGEERVQLRVKGVQT
ncbi:MAG TPA: single-stranded-DNA-specific exonuclease RecJ [Myxococcales bacterium]|nr:single-stranded-DNA-specific exonuclease RecJ [Myxococcales bacterium]